MSGWHREHPEEAERIATLPPSERNAAERAAMVDPLEVADRQRKEAKEAAYYHDQEPERWGDHASPARMRREVAREREEDRS